MLTDLQKAIVTAQDKYLALQGTGTQAQIYEAGLEVKAARKALSEFIAQGAEPCPNCGAAAIGLIQPLERGGIEFEVGCPVCPSFTHTDGTTRRRGARGGPLPRHAVEGWNSGPDYYVRPRPRPAPAPPGP